ncbi:uncharacterized protein LOC124265285 [Haliotis rubra]|uniref:uncharacterized protein LOC124265285 n=1 Tax=Haliotis rubra TaxID=36100 RepID=UPI001EE63200|nr:uncharacterized protein LOC124265285 [Haliotis rubra]
MPQRRPLNDNNRSRAIAWLEDGESLRSVGRRLQVSPSVIHRLRERFQTTGRVQDRARSGRPRKTTRADDRYVVLHALRNRFTTASALRLQLRHATNTNVSISTIWNRLRAANVRSRRPAGSLTGLRYRDEILRPLVLPALNTIGAGAQLQDDNADHIELESLETSCNKVM